MPFRYPNSRYLAGKANRPRYINSLMLILGYEVVCLFWKEPPLKRKDVREGPSPTDS